MNGAVERARRLGKDTHRGQQQCEDHACESRSHKFSWIRMHINGRSNVHRGGRVNNLVIYLGSKEENMKAVLTANEAEVN